MKPDIRIQRIYDPHAGAKGKRVLVDRVWPRGISKEEAHLTLWLKEAAPSTALRKWFGHDPARWDEFQDRYRAELRGNETALEPLRALMADGPVTLLYGARDEAHNNAVALAEYLRRNGD